MLVASIGIQSLLAWSLLPAGRGEYAVLVVTATLLPTVFAFGLDRALQYLLMSRRVGLALALGTLWLIAVAVLVCSWGGLALLVKTGLLQQTPFEAAQWLAALSLCLGSFVHTACLRLHVGARAYGNYLFANVLQSVLSVTGLVVALIVLDSGPIGAVAALAISYLLACAWSTFRLSGMAASARVETQPGSMREGLWFGARVYPALIAHSIDFNAGVLVMAPIAASGEVGMFAAVSALLLRVLLLPQAVQEAVLPRVAEDAAGRRDLVLQMSRLAVLITMLATALVGLLAPVLVGFLLSPSFLPAVPVIWWMVPGVVAHASSTVLMPHFEGRGRPGPVSLASWLGLLVNVLAVVQLYPLMGIAGAGLALSLGMITRLLVLYECLRRETGAALSSLLVPRQLDLAAAWEMALRAAGRRA